MPSPHIRSTASIAGHPLHPMLVPFPIVCFIGAFVTDLAYWKTASVQWETFSVWLITAGLIAAVFAVLAGIVDFLGSRDLRRLSAVWFHAAANGLVVVLSIINAFVHSRDGYTAVVPTGVFLSGVVVLFLLVSGWLGGAMVYRHRVGVVE